MSHRDAPRHAAAPDPHAVERDGAHVRNYRDSTGRPWSVHERLVGDVPPLWARGARCLVFESDFAIRRVWHYPPDWPDLSPPALEALSWGL